MSTTTPSTTTASAPKHIARPLADIACLVRVSDETPEDALQQALSLAVEHQAHLTLAIAAVRVATPYTPFWSGLPSSLTSELNQRTRAAADALADKAREEARIAGINLTVEIMEDEAGSCAAYAVRVGRTADLIVVDQPAAAMDIKSELFEQALFHAGRPVMVATPHHPPITRVKRLALAWDGSAHAARAANDALALFPGIETVDIVSVIGEKDLTRTLPGSDFARHVARKGPTTNLVELTAGGRSVGEVIDDHAVATGADLVAMGGYGHSRWREFVLGGVTVSLVQTARRALLMSH
jgi:nucleotide-binding universal stress UspA family protein